MLDWKQPILGQFTIKLYMFKGKKYNIIIATCEVMFVLIKP